MQVIPMSWLNAYSCLHLDLHSWRREGKTWYHVEHEDGRHPSCCARVVRVKHAKKKMPERTGRSRRQVGVDVGSPASAAVRHRSFWSDEGGGRGPRVICPSNKHFWWSVLTHLKHNVCITWKTFWTNNVTILRSINLPFMFVIPLTCLSFSYVVAHIIKTTIRL